MASVTPWIAFQSAADIPALGGAAWASPGNARAQDGAVASAGPIGPGGEMSVTNTLRLSNAQTAGLPGEPFVPLGVEVEVRGRWTGADATGAITVASHVGGAVRQSVLGGSLPLGSFGTLARGGPANTMGLTAADLASPGFGFQISASASFFMTGPATLEIDSVRWRLHWAPAGQAPALRGRGRGRGAWASGWLA